VSSGPGSAGGPRLLAVSDLHVAYPQNRRLVEDLRPRSEADWLLVAGDVGERMPDIEWALRTLWEWQRRAAPPVLPRQVLPLRM
jgi:hypothetical protein